MGVRDISERFEADLSDVTIAKSIKVGHAKASRLIVLKTEEFGMIGLPVDDAKDLAAAIQREIKRMTS
jgi:hypothetical protein